MSNSLNNIDPAWAWSKFTPSDEQPWDFAAAAHLLRRSGFGASWREIESAAAKSPAEAVAALCEPGDASLQFEEEMAPLDTNVLAAGNAEGLPPWWLYRMLHSPDPLLEKLTLFLHGHFATSAAKVNDVRMMFAQHQLFRRYARGKFGPLVQAISRDPAMLVYLDSTTNRKTHPNENYAREVMELFCLGTGNYTEQDIQELARSFTGWEVHRKKFTFNKYEHDEGQKTILGHTGNFGGDEGVDIVLAQDASPRFIAGKLFRFFVCDEPAPPRPLIEPLARQLRQGGFNISEVVKTILGSQLFFSPHAVGKKIRSPVELGIGLLRSLEGKTNLNELDQRLGTLGQRPFYPPNVKGWDGGRTWINSATLLGRANLVRELLSDIQLEKLPAQAGAASPEAIVDWAIQLLVAVPVADDARASLVELAKRQPEGQPGVANIVHAVGALPEFQLC